LASWNRIGLEEPFRPEATAQFRNSPAESEGCPNLVGLRWGAERWSARQLRGLHRGEGIATTRRHREDIASRAAER